jgi:hypothetical protein
LGQQGPAAWQRRACQASLSLDKDCKSPLYYIADPAMRQLLIDTGAK